MRGQAEAFDCSRYYYKKCSDSGEINCTAGRLVIWFEMGGLEGIGWGEGLTGGEGTGPILLDRFPAN